MFVAWDFENSKIKYGPQKVKVENGDIWKKFRSFVYAPPQEGEYIVVEYDELLDAVVQRKDGSPTTPYKQLRQNAYPEFAAQLDSLWHDIHNGTLDNTGAFYSAIKAIKDTYPK